MSQFSKRLKQKMDERRINQSALARKIKVTPTAVWNWENGNSTPRPATLKKLAQVLAVDEGWLLGEDTSDVPLEIEREIDSVGEEIERLQERIAEINGVDVARVRVSIQIS